MNLNDSSDLEHILFFPFVPILFSILRVPSIKLWEVWIQYFARIFISLVFSRSTMLAWTALTLVFSTHLLCSDFGGSLPCSCPVDEVEVA
jgi:hypothetical protein